MEGRGADLGDRESGSAVAGFLLVSLLVTVMFLGLVQVAVIVHVRSVLIDCAAEGARRASRADRGLADGEDRTRELVTASLSATYARDVVASYVTDGELDLVQVEVSAPIPVIGLWGPAGVITVTGHALREGP
nr:TadE family protein [Sanguibacter gelidistatuariae]